MANMGEKEITRAKELAPLFKEIGEKYEFDEETNKAMANFGPSWFVYLLGGIASRESNFGLLLSNPTTGKVTGQLDGVGDRGHGRGIMQIDDRAHPTFIRSGKWKDPASNIEYGADVWLDCFNFFIDRFELVEESYAKAIRAATAAYNCGAGNVKKALQAGHSVDSRTTGADYSADVITRMTFLKSIHWLG